MMHSRGPTGVSSPRAAGSENCIFNPIDRNTGAAEQFGLHDQPRPNRPPFARRDLTTGQITGEEITATGFRALRKQNIFEFLHASRSPITSTELGLAVGSDRFNAAGRLPDTAHHVDVGRIGVRRCAATGRTSIYWSQGEPQ